MAQQDAMEFLRAYGAVPKGSGGGGGAPLVQPQEPAPAAAPPAGSSIPTMVVRPSKPSTSWPITPIDPKDNQPVPQLQVVPGGSFAPAPMTRGPAAQPPAAQAPSGPMDAMEFLKAYSPQPPAGAQAPQGAPPSQAAAPAAQALGDSRLPLMAGSAFLKGAAQTAGLMGHVLTYDMLPHFSGPPASDAAALAQLSQRHSLLPSDAFTAPLQSAGLIDRPDLVPGQGPNPMLETVGAKAMEGAGSGMVFPGIGNIAAGFAGGGASELAHQMLPGNDWAPVVAGAVAGLGVGGGAAKIATNRANAKLVQNAADAAKASDAAESALAAARDQLNLSKLTNPQDMLALRGASEAQRDAAIAAAQAKAQVQQALGAPMVEGVRQSLGTSGTLQEAGAALQSSARDWLTNVMPQRMEALWSPVRDAAGAETQVPRSGFAAALQKLNTAAGDNQTLVDAITPALPKKLQAIFAESGEAPQSMSDALALRSAIGNAMSNPSVTADIPAQQLSALYRAQSEDIRHGLAALPNGPDMLRMFDQANAESAKLYGIAQGPMAKIVSGKAANLAHDPKPEDVASKLLSGAARGASDLSVLRQEIPTGVNELAAAHLAQPGAWQNLSPEARAVLVPDPNARNTLERGLTLRDGGAAEAQAAIAAAKAEHSKTIQEAQRAGQQDILEQSFGVRDLGGKAAEAKAAAQAAQAALPAGGPPKFDLRQMQHSLLGPEIGSAIGALGHGLIPGASELTGGAAGMLAGVALPMALRGTVAIARNPAALRFPLAGTLPQINALGASAPIDLTPGRR